MQHRVFQHFIPFQGELPGNYQYDFLGTKMCHPFVAGLQRQEGLVITEFPKPEEDYFEWIDILESVVAAKGSFTMLDLGAGYGRWSVRAAYAVQQFHPGLPYHLISVEAEPVVFNWMRQHFTDNGIDPNRHRLIHAAVTDATGSVLFYVGGPSGGPYDRAPDEWYGQFVTKDYDVAGRSKREGEYHGFAVTHHESGWRSIDVPTVSLRDLLSGQERVDLIDMDIEGQELPAIRSSIDALDAKVKRLHIGTHGKEIEAELRQLLAAHGWRCHADYSLFSTSETPYGTVQFENGVQSWENEALADR